MHSKSYGAGRGCRRTRLLGILALGVSIVYAVVVVAAPEAIALTLLRVFAAVASLLMGWLVFRLTLLYCPRRSPPGGFVREVAGLEQR